jgi:FeS assembly SUF system protein
MSEHNQVNLVNPSYTAADLHGQSTDAEPLSVDELENQIIAALKTVYDPEIPVDVYELGLIYHIDINTESRHVDVDMTLTAPGCPVAGSMPEWVREAVADVPGVDSVNVELVWEPPWTPERMSMRAKLELNMF